MNHYTPPTSPFTKVRHHSHSGIKLKEGDNPETETDSEEGGDGGRNINITFTRLKEIEKKYIVMGREIEAAEGYNRQNELALMEMQSALLLKESMLYQKETILYEQEKALQQREKDIASMFQIKENYLKHQKELLTYRCVQLNNRAVRLSMDLAEMRDKKNKKK
jgi:hypothetical protein